MTFVAWRGETTFVAWRGETTFVAWRGEMTFVAWRGETTFASQFTVRSIALLMSSAAPTPACTAIRAPM
jgi:hypothetical protein